MYGEKYKSIYNITISSIMYLFYNTFEDVCSRFWLIRQFGGLYYYSTVKIYVNYLKNLKSYYRSNILIQPD